MLFSGRDSSEYTSRQPSHTVTDRYHWKSSSSADSDEKRTLKKPKSGTPERDALNTIIGVCRRQREDGSDVDDLFSQHLRQASGEERATHCVRISTQPQTHDEEKVASTFARHLPTHSAAAMLPTGIT